MARRPGRPPFPGARRTIDHQLVADASGFTLYSIFALQPKNHFPPSTAICAWLPGKKLLNALKITLDSKLEPLYNYHNNNKKPINPNPL